MRHHSLRSYSGVLLMIAWMAFAAPAGAQTLAEPDSAAFVTMLGKDTLSVERWVRTSSGLEAVAAVRTPRTTVRHYAVRFAPDGTMQQFEERIYNPSHAGSAPVEAVRVEAAGGEWVRTVTEGDSTRTARFSADASVLPFVDLVFWPYELILLRGASEHETTQPLLAGTRALPFTVVRDGADRVTIAHPFRGPSVATVDAEGRLLSLDASETTRKVVVTRVPWLDVDAHARRWAAADRAGRSLGELSGRAEPEYTVGDATIALDYGTPSKRGRDIFGNVVPWGELWRTGANRATHFMTDRTLVLGDPTTGTLTVPAGTYTLFSIPEPDGGVLIVSRQTGQNGNSYDAAQDLGRVPMRVVQADTPVEVFTIRADPRSGQSGVLRLMWDRTEFHVPFTVQ